MRARQILTHRSVLGVAGALAAGSDVLSFDGRRYRWSGGPMDLDTCLRVFARVERPWRPLLLRDLVDSGALVLGPAVAAVVPLAWASGHPEDAVERGRWLEWFGAVGFTVEGTVAQRPGEPVTLYRGCTRGAVRRMAWTAEPAAAWVYAHGRVAGRLPGQIWAAVVAPEYLLACLARHREYVVDPCGLTDVRCTGW